jgi:hypothetical protein
MSKLKAAPLPHSWLASEWVSGVAPNRQLAANHLIRTHRDELIACGALCRIGRNLVVIGEGYAQFLARKVKRVEGYQIAPNREPPPAADNAAP